MVAVVPLASRYPGFGGDTGEVERHLRQYEPDGVRIEPARDEPCPHGLGRGVENVLRTPGVEQGALTQVGNATHHQAAGDFSDLSREPNAVMSMSATSAREIHRSVCSS